MKNKFEFYEIVEIKPKFGTLDLSTLDTRNFDYQKLVGQIGVIVAMCEEDSEWYYTIKLSDKDGDEYSVSEYDLISTGQKANPEDYKPVDTIKVRVNPKTDEGEIVEDEEN